jgi:hypothetical protein
MYFPYPIFLHTPFTPNTLLFILSQIAQTRNIKFRRFGVPNN